MGDCQDTPAYVPLNEYDVMWGEFPGSKAVPRCMNHIKMGYPNWKRMLSQLARQEVNRDGFMRFWSSHANYPKKRIKAAWESLSKQDIIGSWAEKVFNST